VRVRTLVWFRGKDLRVADHAPLRDAARDGEIVCAFAIDPYFFAPPRARELPHRMQFLLESIDALAESIAALGGELVLVRGKSIEVVPELARAARVDRVVAHRWTEPFGRERDARVARALGAIPFALYEGETLAAPGALVTKSGTPYEVFTPFARAHRARAKIDAPLAPPRAARFAHVRFPRAKLPTLASLGIARNDALLEGGEPAARARLRAFVKSRAARYDRERDRLDLASTSRLSADLKFGTLSVREVWCATKRALASRRAAWKSFSNELLWREFTHAVLFANPRLLGRPHRAAWEGFPWRRDERAWNAWCEGRTGYPVVDAAARQLLAEGFVHNRARMIAASFLVKDLLIDYRRGEAHYLRFLTDGDWAQNNAGWQWTTGCGFDAQPFFRVFNPVDQARRFDPTGAYVRKWVPEIAALGDDDVHAPFEADAKALSIANVRLGETYPRPIVDHARARVRFLEVAKGYLAR